MDVNYSKEPITVDCTANVQFEVIPPNVAEIPLPEDISQIPLPSSSPLGVPNTNVDNVESVPMEVCDTVPSNACDIENFHNLEKKPVMQDENVSDSCAIQEPIKELCDDSVDNIDHEESKEDTKYDSQMEILDDDVSQDALVISTDSETPTNIDMSESLDISFEKKNISIEEEQLETQCPDLITAQPFENQDVPVSGSLITEKSEPNEQYCQFQIIPPSSEQCSDISEFIKNEEQSTVVSDVPSSVQCIMVTQSNQQTAVDTIISAVVTENQQNFVEYVSDTGSEKVLMTQANEQNILDYVASDSVSNKVSEEHQNLVEFIEPEIGDENISVGQPNEQNCVEYVKSETNTEKASEEVQNQENIDEFGHESENMNDKVTDQQNVQYVAESTHAETRQVVEGNQQGFIEYIDGSVNVNENIVTSQDNSVQFVHAETEVHNIPRNEPVEQNSDEYVECVKLDSEKEVSVDENEGNFIEYTVSDENVSADAQQNQENYVQFVVSDDVADKVGSDNSNQLIEYVVSDGSNEKLLSDQDGQNFVQFVVTSSASDTVLSNHENSEQYVEYIVSEGDDDKIQSNDDSQITYQVVEDNSQETESQVVIEEMEVDEMPNSDQNDDIEIYVIEDNNMQTVIEVHVENVDDEISNNMPNVPDLVPLSNKSDSKNKKRLSTGNYIEVIDSKGDTTAKLPCHVLGRNLKNPEADVLSNGRMPPKVRPGVKVPPMSLSSCIVTSDEITDEIENKLKSEIPKSDKPKEGDLLFKHKITKRLAEKLCLPASASANSQMRHSVQPRTRSSPNTRQTKRNSLSTTKPKTDNADLLAILEGDDDPDWSDLKATEHKDHSPPILQAIEKSIISGRSDKSPPPVLEPQQKPRTIQAGNRPLLKLDSEEKRKLAKHQLMNMPHVPNICSSRPRGRPRLTDYNPLKQTLLKNAGMAVYTTPRSKDPPKTYSNRKANDIIKTLVSDWDEESHDDPKAVDVPSTSKAVESKKVDAPKTQNDKPMTTTTTDAVKTPVTSTPNTTTAKTPPMSTATKRKNTTPPSTEPQLGIVPNKIARIIKKKIIWDPANPATYSSANGTKSTPKKDIATSAKTTPETTPVATTKKTSMQPKKLIEKQQEMKEVHVIIETVEDPPTETPSTSSKPEVKKTVHKVKTVPSIKNKVIRKLPRKHIFTKHRLMHPSRLATKSAVNKIPLLKKKKKLTEIDKLLMDEGAVNMLYAVERSNNNTEVPEIITRPNKRLLISLEKERRNLLSKANIIKQAVLRHSTLPGSSRIAKPLRFKKSPDAARKIRQGRKKSEASEKSNRTSVQSPTLEENPDFTFTEVNESRIIRRHSSSSYSSTCTSPRRLSVDLDTTKPTEESANKESEERKDDLEHTKPLKKRQKGVPIFIRPEGAEKTYKGKTKSSTENLQDKTSTEVTAKPSTPTSKPMSTRSAKKSLSNKSTPEMDKTKVTADVDKPKTTPKTTEKSKSTPEVTDILKNTPEVKDQTKTKAETTDKTKSTTEATNKTKSMTEPTDKIKSVTEATNKTKSITDATDQTKSTTEATDKTKNSEESDKNKLKTVDDAQKDQLSTCLQEVHTSLTEISDETSVPMETAEVEDAKKDTTKVASKKTRKSTGPEVEKIHNLRHAPNNYKEISIRRHDYLVQIILTPTSSKFKNSLNLQALRELREVLVSMSKDASCRVVLLTSSGNIFCQGLDYSTLIQSSVEKRRSVGQEMAHAVVELLRILATFPKILIAGVHGAAVGLGATMLPLFDLVLASDKATFSVPATKHGHVPEGTTLMPWHRLLGHSVINELVLACRELTASEALQYGLITRILWPDKFHAELVPTVKTLTAHSTQAMVTTKAMLRQQLLNGLDDALQFEEKQLFDMWTSPECQESFKTALADGLWE